MQIVEDEPGTSRFVRLLRRPNSAFTLVELVVVVLVIGILAAVSLPKVFDQSTASELTTIRLSLQTIQDQIELRHAVTGKYPSTIDKKWFSGKQASPSSAQRRRGPRPACFFWRCSPTSELQNARSVRCLLVQPSRRNCSRTCTSFADFGRDPCVLQSGQSGGTH